MSPKLSLLSSESALLSGISAGGTVVEELSRAIDRDRAEPGALLRFIRRDFIRLDHALERLAVLAVGQRLQQFALTLRVCLRAAAEGHAVDWAGVVAFTDTDAHISRH